jgi:transposase
VSDASSSPLSKDEQILQLQNQLAWAELKIQVLEARLRSQRIQKYGPASEKLSSEQLELLEWEPGVSRFEVQAEGQREPLPASSKRERPRKHPGRQELPAGLPRVERVLACTAAQCTCAACGKPTEVIGYDVSEQLDVEPAQYFVVVT